VLARDNRRLVERRLVERASRGEVRVDVEEVPLEAVADAWRRQAEGAGRKLVFVA